MIKRKTNWQESAGRLLNGYHCQLLVNLTENEIISEL